MTTIDEPRRSTFYRCFVRDQAKCRYCGKDLLASYDSFAASCLDHLKPACATGAHEDEWNRVTAGAVCNHLKGRFDPLPDGAVTPATFETCVERAREHIAEKRSGTRDNSYYRDYLDWLKEFDRTALA